MSPVLKKYFLRWFSKDFIFILLLGWTEYLSLGHQDADAKAGYHCPGVNCWGCIVRGELFGGESSGGESSGGELS